MDANRCGSQNSPHPTQTVGIIKIKFSWPHLGLVFFVTLALYLLTMPRGLALEDDGLFTLASYFSGLAHPPGYPLHTLFGKLFTLLPVGSIAYRVHMLSAFFAALTCVLIWLICFFLLHKRVLAYFSALSYSVSQAFWSQAIIAEVYSLNTFFFFLLFLSILLFSSRYQETGGKIQPQKIQLYIIFISLLLGLGLTNHWPLLLLSVPSLLALCHRQWPILIKYWYYILFGVLVGLTPYLWMYMHSHSDPVISFIGPLEDFKSLWNYISRHIYSAMDSSPNAGWGDKMLFFGFAASEAMRQYFYIGGIFAVLGFGVQWGYLPRNICIALTLAFFGSTLFLIILLNFEFELVNRLKFKVYPLISYAVMAFWISIAIDYLAKKLSQASKSNIQKRTLVYLFGLLVFIPAFILNIKQNDRHNYHWTENYARAVLESLEKDAVLFVDSDENLGPIAYLNMIEKVRPDVTLYNSFGFIFSNRLFKAIGTDTVERVRIYNNFVNSTDRPIYHVEVYPKNFGYIDSWLIKKVDRDDIKNKSFVINARQFSYFRFILQQKTIKDQWTVMHREILLSNMIVPLVNYLSLNRDDPRSAELKGYVQLASESYLGKLEYVNATRLFQKEYNPHDLLAVLEQANTFEPFAHKNRDIARLRLYRGQLLFELGDKQGAEKSFKQAIDVWKHPNNEAYNSLKKLYSS